MYTVDYFIKKFEAIPEEKWCSTYLTYDDQHCALGHCGVEGENLSMQMEIINHLEGKSLADLLRPLTGADKDYTAVYYINDDTGTNPYKLPTPKQRILAALYDIKANQAVEDAKEIIKSIPASFNNVQQNSLSELQEFLKASEPASEEDIRNKIMDEQEDVKYLID